ncbi:unnamed protein product [Alopecurus aequalis]
MDHLADMVARTRLGNDANFLGAPATRPESDSCFMATPFDLDTARLDWEHSAMVAWVLSPPPGTDRTSVESAFRREYRLSAADLSVSAHFPEPFLVKFATAGLRDEVMRTTKRSTFKRHGLELHFRPWRCVSHAYNADLHFRVHLAVDGLSPFAWRPEVVDRIVGRRCAVQCLDEGFTSMEVTHSFGLWAWTAEPHKIPKVLWCTFANKAPGGLSSLVRVAEDRPDQWKRGVTFLVLLHVECIEDFSGAPVLDGGAAISDFRPSSRDLPEWRLGVIDGSQEGSSAVTTAPIPPLGRDQVDRERSSRNRRHADSGDTRDTGRRSQQVGSGRDRSRGDRDRSRGGTESGRDRSRGDQERSNGSQRRSQSRRGNRCDDRELRRSSRDEDDDENQRREDGGARRNSSRSHGGDRHVRAESRRAVRDRERSPRRRSQSRGDGGRRHATKGAPSLAPRLPSIIIDPRLVITPPTPQRLSDDEVTAQLEALMLSGLTAARTSSTAFLGIVSPAPSSRESTPPAPSPFSLACRRWIDGIRSAPPGLTATSYRLASPMPCFSKDAAGASQAGSTDAAIHVMLPPPPSPFALTCRDWANGIRASPPGFTAASSRLARPLLTFDASSSGVLAGLSPDADAALALAANPGLSTWGSGPTAELAPMLSSPRAASSSSHPHAVPTDWEELSGDEAWSEPAAVCVSDAVVAPMVPIDEFAQELVPENAPVADDLGVARMLDLLDAPAPATPGSDPVMALFSEPGIPILPRPLATPAATALASSDGVMSPAVSTVRRSARIGALPQMPTMDKAVRVLNRKLGVCVADEMPLALARKKFVEGFQNKMPDKAIQAISHLLKLKMSCLVRASDALVSMAGPGGTEFALSADQEALA